MHESFISDVDNNSQLFQIQFINSIFSFACNIINKQHLNVHSGADLGGRISLSKFLEAHALLTA